MGLLDSAWNVIAGNAGGQGSPIPGLANWLGLTTQPPPGVAGPSAPGDVLQPTPQGTFLNPRTGQTYVDPQGQIPVGNVNSAQITGSTFGTQNSLLGGLGDIRNQQQGTFDAQNRLAGSLEGTINGTNPSVALYQLGQGQDAIARQQVGAAAGASGVNAPLAHLAAMGNIANAQAQENQAQSLVRAREVADAQSSLAGLYGTQLGAENAMAGTLAGTASNYANISARSAGEREKTAADIGKGNASTIGNLYGTLGGMAKGLKL